MKSRTIRMTKTRPAVALDLLVGLVRRCGGSLCGRGCLENFNKSYGRCLRMGLAVENPASRRRGAPLERDLRARFFRWSVTSGHASSAGRKNSIRETRPGGRVPPARRAPEFATRNTAALFLELL